jgi:hypothetical protein
MYCGKVSIDIYRDARRRREVFQYLRDQFLQADEGVLLANTPNSRVLGTPSMRFCLGRLAHKSRLFSLPSCPTISEVAISIRPVYEYPQRSFKIM